MGNTSNETPSSPPPKRPRARSSRRTFIARAVGGLAISVPAIRALASTAPAVAASPAAACSSYYVRYNGHHCNIIEETSCPTGIAHRCIGEYDKYDSKTGQYCGYYKDDEGPCA
jgi:hypothetical protein